MLALVADGHTAGTIARRLLIGERTVHKHLQHLYAKLDVTDRLSAVLTAQRLGFLRPHRTARRGRAFPAAWINHEGSATTARCGIATAGARDPPAPAVTAAPAIAGYEATAVRPLDKPRMVRGVLQGARAAATAGAAEDPDRSPHPDASPRRSNR